MRSSLVAIAATEMSVGMFVCLVPTLGAVPTQDDGGGGSEHGGVGAPAFDTVIVEFVTEDLDDTGGDEEVTKTLYYDRAESRWAQVWESPRGGRTEMSDGTWEVEYSSGSTTGSKRWVSPYMRAFPKWMVAEDQLERMGVEKDGVEEIAGVPCDRWVRVLGPSETTIWTWNGIQLGYRNKMGDMGFGEMAVSVQVDAELPEDVFQVPSEVELEERVLPGTPLLRALESQEVPADSTSSLPDPEASFQFPTIEPFEASRMWDVILAGDDLELDVDRGVTFMGVEMMAMGEASRAVERLVGKRPEESGASARMADEIGAEERLWWRAVPRVIQALSPLYESEDWTEEQVATAKFASRFLSLGEHGPHLNLAVSEGDARRPRLAAVGRWFLEQVDIPERYAAMIVTSDYGPFVGLPADPEAAGAVLGRLDLGGGKELRLCESEGSDPFLLQYVADGDVAWSRFFTDAPDRTISKVEFVDEPPQELGPYGWKVHLFVDWEHGSEYSHLYLDRDGELLFYFISW